MQPEKDIEALKSVSSLEVQQEIVDGHFFDSCNLHQACGRVSSNEVFFSSVAMKFVHERTFAGFTVRIFCSLLSLLAIKSKTLGKHPKSYAGGSSSLCCQNL